MVEEQTKMKIHGTRETHFNEPVKEKERRFVRRFPGFAHLYS
jgi:hypothetical protein